MTAESKTAHTPGSQCVSPSHKAPLAWDGYRTSCHSTYNGGHHDEDTRKAFHHGMDTVFNLLEAEFPGPVLCKASPDLLKACKGMLTEWARNTETNPEYRATITVIATAEGDST